MIPQKIAKHYIPEPNTGCWIWHGFLRNGYGKIVQRGKTWIAHRLVYELLVGPIPEGLVIDHLCRNTWCVNPDHLEPVTPAENTRRGFGPQRMHEARRAITHCAQGHKYTAESTMRRKGSGHRQCRICANECAAKYRARKREMKTWLNSTNSKNILREAENRAILKLIER